LGVRNHKRRTLNTQLSSVTSAGTFACPAGPYRNSKGEAGTKNEPNWYFVPDRKKGPKIDPHVSNLRSREFLFEGFRSILNKTQNPLPNLVRGAPQAHQIPMFFKKFNTEMVQGATAQRPRERHTSTLQSGACKSKLLLVCLRPSLVADKIGDWTKLEILV